jgi:hypothetical protein
MTALQTTGRLLGARALLPGSIFDAELPNTSAAFAAGRITESRATTIARETACLSLEDRRTVDRAIAGDLDALQDYSDRVLLGEPTGSPADSTPHRSRSGAAARRPSAA